MPHIIFSQKDYEEKGPIIKCNPSIKSEEDLEALKQGLKDGRIDYLATDHAPHLSEEKKINILAVHLVCLVFNILFSCIRTLSFKFHES